MKLEKRILFSSGDVLDPEHNMATNRSAVDYISKNEVDVILRIYKHKPGVIIGKSQNKLDVNLNELDKHNLKIAQRSTGGAAVYVDPETTLCYSLFYRSSALSNDKDVRQSYFKVVEPLAKYLSNQLVTGQTHYIGLDDKSGFRPLVGHGVRMHNLKGETVFQLDGLLHIKPLDINLVSKVIPLRKIYSREDEKILSLGDETYRVEKNSLIRENYDLSNYELIIDEENKINDFLSLQELEISQEEFELNMLKGIKNIFKKDHEYFSTDELVQNSPNYEKYLLEATEISEKDLLQSGTFKGHCFVYIPSIQDTDKKVK